MRSRPGRIPANVPVLVPLHGPGDRRPRPLDGDVTTVGRARGCDLCLEASDVSTLHCLLFRTADGIHVRDCNSRSGTRVNGEPVRGCPALADGDILHLGPFTFQVKVPARLSPGGETADPARVQHWQESRRRLAAHALRLRRLLHAQAVPSADGLEEERGRLRREAEENERRRDELEHTRRQLEAEREAIRERVQEVERDLAGRMEEAEKQVRARWQEFQLRCRTEEARLRAPAEPRPAVPAGDAARREAAGEQQRELAQQAEALARRRQELDAMKQQFEAGQAEAHAALDKQRAAQAQQEAALRAQRAEVARMIGELRDLQAALRRPPDAERQALAEENERLRAALADVEARAAQPAAAPELEAARVENDVLRTLLHEHQQELAALRQHLGDVGGRAECDPAAAEALRSENERLKQLLAEKDGLGEDLRARPASRPPKSANELESYEAELNAERKELELERAKLHTEIEQLRVRNEELDEATREMEMEMSRERAEMARERIRIERMREELKADMERMQREMSVRESLAPVQRLREELAQKKAAAKPGETSLNDRLRAIRPNQDTPRG